MSIITMYYVYVASENDFLIIRFAGRIIVIGRRIKNDQITRGEDRAKRVRLRLRTMLTLAVARIRPTRNERAYTSCPKKYLFLNQFHPNVPVTLTI